MKKILKYIILEIVIIVLLIIVLPSFFITKKTGINKEGGQAVLSLQKGKIYSQKIYNSSQSLNSVSLQLKNPMIRDNSLINIDIQNESGDSQREFTIYGSNIGDPSWIKLNFPPIVEQNLIIKVSSESPEDNSLYLYADKNGLFDMKTTYKLPTFKQRLIQNYYYQINQALKRSSWHNLIYAIIVFYLNFQLIKMKNENNKK